MRSAYEKDKTTLSKNQENRLKMTKSSIPSDFFRVTSNDIVNTSDKTEADIKDLSDINSTSTTKMNSSEEESKNKENKRGSPSKNMTSERRWSDVVCSSPVAPSSRNLMSSKSTQSTSESNSKKKISLLTGKPEVNTDSNTIESSKNLSPHPSHEPPSPITETQLVNILCENPTTRITRLSTSQKKL